MDNAPHRLTGLGIPVAFAALLLAAGPLALVRVPAAGEPVRLLPLGGTEAAAALGMGDGARLVAWDAGGVTIAWASPPPFGTLVVAGFLPLAARAGCAVAASETSPRARPPDLFR